MGAAKEICVCESLVEGSDDGSCAFCWETNPTCQFAWCGNNEQKAGIVGAGGQTIAERIATEGSGALTLMCFVAGTFLADGDLKGPGFGINCR